jgi:hypothetical protein
VPSSIVLHDIAPGDIMACYGGGQSAKNECLSAYGLVES